MNRKISTLAVIASVAFAAWTAPAQADHSWGSWHWQRATNPVKLTVFDSTTDARTLIGGQNWPVMLSKSAADWTTSTVLDLAVQPQTAADLAVREACPFELGAIRVCNVVNPDVTWLGLATVLPADPGSRSGHLLAATAQMNDTWFSTPFYDATNAQHVMCQEVGHTLGLDHQDESGKDLGTCMDYADALDNESPDSHDYQQLQTIYTHLDGASSGSGGGGRGGGKPKGGKQGKSGSTAATGGWSPADLGLPAAYHGTGTHGRPHSDVFVTQIEGQTVLRYVLWAY